MSARAVVASFFFFSLANRLLVCCTLFFFLMIRRPPRSTLDRSSAASDVYKRQTLGIVLPDSLVSGTKYRKFRHELLRRYRVDAVVRLPSGSFMHTDAVSYTHLRAHETVLDLVCRLLLEKKKINIHNHDVVAFIPTNTIRDDDTNR